MKLDVKAANEKIIEVIAVVPLSWHILKSPFRHFIEKDLAGQDVVRKTAQGRDWVIKTLGGLSWSSKTR